MVEGERLDVFDRGMGARASLYPLSFTTVALDFHKLLLQVKRVYSKF